LEYSHYECLQFSGNFLRLLMNGAVSFEEDLVVSFPNGCPIKLGVDCGPDGISAQRHRGNSIHETRNIAGFHQITGPPMQQT
jgi:hypothetical protein